MCKCVLCGREYEYNHSKGHTKTKCNSCVVNERRFKLKDKMIIYKGGQCSICGYNKSKRALDFHHLVQEDKEFGFSGKHAFSWDKIQNELDKCILVCCRCHMEIHDGLLAV